MTACCMEYTTGGLIFRKSMDKAKNRRKLTKKKYVEILRNNSKITDEKIVNLPGKFPVINRCGQMYWPGEKGRSAVAFKCYHLWPPVIV